MKEYPKILIVSHNALSKVNNNGKTIETFFNKWPKCNLAHLYLSPEDEDIDFCDNSFCVHDYDALDNCLRFKKKRHGRKIDNVHNNSEDGSSYGYIVRKLYQANKSAKEKNKLMSYIHESAVERKPYMTLIRHLVWKNTSWFIEDIYKWVALFEPDILFFQGSGVFYSYNIVKKISEKFSIPIILECTDDYTLPLNENSLIDKWLTNNYLNIFKTVIKEAQAIFVISEKMRIEYCSLYGGQNYYVLSNSINRNFSNKTLNTEGEITFLYAGNIGLNRWEQLARLGEVLDSINETHKLKMKLIIHTGNKITNEIATKLNLIKSLTYRGFVSSQELDNIVENSDFLIHVESFDEHYKRVTRLSMSTKIGEYLASNRCIIAFGPNDVASIEYIKNNNLGIVITSLEKEDIEKEITRIISKKNLYELYTENAQKEYFRTFSQDVINKKVYEAIKGIYK